MQRIIVTLGLLVSTLHLFGQQKSPDRYAARITAADLKKQLTIVAGPEMEGRETSTTGQKKAAAYIEGYFKSLGLKPGNESSYQQVFSLFKDSMVSSRLVVGKDELRYGHDYMMSVRLNNTRAAKAKSVVFAGYGISDSAYNDYENLDVQDAVVVLALGEPKSGNSYLITGTNQPSSWSLISTKRKAALEKGAVGIFVVSPRLTTIDSSLAWRLSVTDMNLQREPTSDTTLPGVANISRAAYERIFDPAYCDSILKKFDAYKSFSPADHRKAELDVVFDYAKTAKESGNSSKVIAVLEGSDKKDEYVFLTAHYDHLGKRNNTIYYGADDDGSGTVSVMEMAEAFARAKADGNGPRRSIVFMAVSGEEKGLLGSEYYSDHPLFPLEKTTVNLNTDMVGRIDPKRTTGDSTNYIYVIGDNKLSSDLKPISEATNHKYTRLELDYKYNDPNDQERIYYRSDHYNFARKGVPILFYFSGTHADYHRPTD
ncbi:MAG TPA: M28 family peptidase, partial [Chitinophagaceae bacterium]|nr:M28 family peptidase [Chitinophagaceae bacterium]